jgi:hypothetical protein
MPSSSDYTRGFAMLLLSGGMVLGAITLAFYGAFMLGGWTLVGFVILIYAICYLLIRLIMGDSF